MRRRTFRRKKRLGVVREDENEPGEEPSQYTSQSLRLATVQPGAYTHWSSLTGNDGTGLPRIWQMKDRYSPETQQFEEVLEDNTDQEEEDDEDIDKYDDEMLNMMRKQVLAEKKIKQQHVLQLQQDKIIWNTTSYKLTSLEGKGEAELIRFILVIADQPFEDERLTVEDWEEIKAETPYQTLPVLSKCGWMWGETGAIVRTFARKFLLMGDTNDEHLIVEATYERLRRLQRQHSRAINWVIRGEKNKEKLEWAQGQLMHVILPPAIKEWDNLIRKTKGPYIVESGMTLADLAVFDFLDQCGSHLVIKPLLIDNLGVHDLLMIIRTIPKVVSYLDDRPVD